MISVSKLWCGSLGSGDALRYGPTAHRRPVVVWNCTRRCNLRCVHCYSQSENRAYPGEITTTQGARFIHDLGEYGVPVILFSGGEPLMRLDIFNLAKLAEELGIRAVLSTNGTLITQEVAAKIKTAGFSYVGVSLDGLNGTNDRFRGVQGAFDAAIKGIRNCINEGIKTGLRFTLTRYNFGDVPGIFKLVEEERISRVCFYHLVYSGRGSNLISNDLSHSESREVMDQITTATEALHGSRIDAEVLTVDNHADAAYLYLKIKENSHARASKARDILKMNGGNSSGIGICSVDPNGGVHADQFWQHYTIGSILERKFSELWGDENDPLLGALRDRRSLLKGRCRTCRFLDICNGNLRVRAEAVFGDLWAPDPACYLTETEITGHT
ncbi:MAG: radical SAM protein [Candidatus Bathyarchaeia archaeon]